MITLHYNGPLLLVAIMGPLMRLLWVAIINGPLNIEVAFAVKFGCYITGHLSISIVSEEVFLMAVGDTTLGDDMAATVSVMVGFNGVDSTVDSVVIDFMITAGEKIAPN